VSQAGRGSAETASLGEVFFAALRLGLTSFGGPVAHLGYFRTEYVDRRRWLDDEAYAEIVAISQFLPGPASSQVGFAVGMTQRGLSGGLAAWVGFTLPSALLLAGFGAVAASGILGDPVWLQALKIVAVAVVLDAVLGMARRLTATARTATVGVLTFGAVVLAPSGVTQVAALLVAAVAGLWLFRDAAAAGPVALPVRVSRRVGAACLVSFVALLAAVPALSGAGPLAELAATTYRAGSLVFGGGHVVLPLLEQQVVPDLMDSSTFLAGYGAAQAVPGPLFTFATYLGQVAAGVPGAIVATVFIFLPGFLLLVGVLPFWAGVRDDRRVQSALVGVNAAVVGVLAAALYDPIITSTLTGPVPVVFAAGLFVLLHVWRAPAWAVVLVAVAASPVLLLA
jgi:chromate transporter